MEFPAERFCNSYRWRSQWSIVGRTCDFNLRRVLTRGWSRFALVRTQTDRARCDKTVIDADSEPQGFSAITQTSTKR